MDIGEAIIEKMLFHKEDAKNKRAARLCARPLWRNKKSPLNKQYKDFFLETYDKSYHEHARKLIKAKFYIQKKQDKLISPRFDSVQYIERLQRLFHHTLLKEESYGFIFSAKEWERTQTEVAKDHSKEKKAIELLAVALAKFFAVMTYILGEPLTGSFIGNRPHAEHIIHTTTLEFAKYMKYFGLNLRPIKLRLKKLPKFLKKEEDLIRADRKKHHTKQEKQHYQIAGPPIKASKIGALPHYTFIAENKDDLLNKWCTELKRFIESLEVLFR